MFWRLVSYAKGLLRRRAIEAEVDDELRFHLEMEAQANIARGMTAGEARRAALREFGGVTQTREAVRDVRSTVFDSLRQDVRFAVRTFRRNPGFTLVAIVTLALGIGANTSIFSLVDAVLFRPLPFRDPGRLTWVMGYSERTGTLASTIGANAYAEIARHHRGVASVACASWNGPSFTLADRAGTRLNAHQVCANLLDVLGVRPAIGRGFVREEGTAANENVAVLMHAAWQKHFGGDPRVAGRTVMFKEHPVTIAGIMPPEFVVAPLLFFDPPDLLVPGPPPSGRFAAVAVARLKPGVTLAQAQAELDSIGRGLQAGNTRPWTRDMKVMPLQAGVFDSIRPLSQVLFAAACLVLLLASVNLANLLLARGSWRERELAIRASLGAGRGRLVRQLLVEGLLLSLTGGVLGLGLAWLTFNRLYAGAPSRLFQALPTGVDWRVLGFAFVVSIATGLASAVLPALRITGSRLTWSVQEGWRPARAAAARSRGTALVAAQMAIVVVVLTAAGLMLNSLVRALTMDLGVDVDRAVVIKTSPPRQAWRSASSVAAYYRDAATIVKAMPGVRRVAGVCSLTVGGSFAPYDAMLREGPRENRGARYYVTADYFSALGIKRIAGRTFTPAEIERSAPVAVVNESAARRLWPGDRAVGKQFGTGTEPSREVIGVVADTRDAYDSAVRPSLYVPPDPAQPLPLDLVAAVDGDTAAASAAISKRLAREDARAVVEPLAAVVRRTTKAERFQTLLLALFAGLALVLAAVGIGGIVGYTVARRTREMGVRIALGATPPSIVRLVVAQTVAVVAAGAGVGVCGALAVTRVLRGLLFQVKPNDPLTFAAAIAALLLVAVGASLLPALRAGRVDPIAVLKAD